MTVTPRTNEGTTPTRLSSFTLPSGIIVGHAHDSVGGTGCSVILCEAGAVCGVDVRGGGPATRETDLLKPENMIQSVHAIVLSGGSAFGLDAAGGVMRYLEERQVGYAVGTIHVPIVCGASLFDLTVGDPSCRPDAQMGYLACANATAAPATEGNVGAGCAASVGKILGPQNAMKSGFGTASIQTDDLIVTAVVAVNALGNVIDRMTGETLAGVLDPLSDIPRILDPFEAFSLLMKEEHDAFSGNTTIGCVITNAQLTKAQATKIASMTHDAYARTIDPVHTSNDGDTIFVLSTDCVPFPQDIVGIYAVAAMEQAIQTAVLGAEGAFGLKSAHDLTTIVLD